MGDGDDALEEIIMGLKNKPHHRADGTARRKRRPEM